MNEADKAALLEEIAASRRRLNEASERFRGSAADVRQMLDVPQRLASSYRKHRPAWIGGAALLGFLLSRIPSRKKTIYVDEATGNRIRSAGKLGALWSFAKFATAIAKPLIGDFLSDRLTDFARRYAGKNKAANPPKTDDDLQ